MLLKVTLSITNFPSILTFYDSKLFRSSNFYITDKRYRNKEIESADIARGAF